MNQQQPAVESCVFVILGATGDLTKRKIIPALYQLIASGSIDQFAVVGAAMGKTTMQEILAQARTFIPRIREDVWHKLERNAHYYSMDFYDTQAYVGLATMINDVERTQSLSGNRLFYLAAMPHHFTQLTQQLAAHAIAARRVEPAGPWHRVVYEKPFGDSLASARQINQAIAAVFDEEQVFRIDHYLGKELVGNIALSRFTNRIFEPLWNCEHIDSVQIVLSETLGVEGRGQFYDAYGTLKDVVQNHMLQILALIAMEVPERFTAQHLRDAKAAVLARVIVEHAILGQYEGYRAEPNVNPQSQTDTFAALQLTVDTPRWKGVPFYLKAGKRLYNSVAAVHIKFKMPKCLIDFCPTDSNYLTINIQPNEGMYLELNVKTPGVFNQITPVRMDFSHSVLFGPNTPAAYEVLLLDVLRGDHFAFVRADEIDSSWSIIQQIDTKKEPLHLYAPGSWGPAALNTLDPNRKIIWKT